MSDIWLSVAGSSTTEGLMQLSAWLRQEPDLRTRVAFAPTAPSPGELGTAMDALVVAVGSGGALSVLAASLKAFLALPRRSDIRLTIRQSASGHAVELDMKRVSDVEAILREVLGRSE